MSRWWHGAVGYQVYLRSFADADGDGVGDLYGLRDRLDHLAWLGVDVLWISPCFPSPQADHGYDVADYLTVAEEYGGTEALDAVLARARELGLRVLLDLVPNHTSTEHSWFRAARSSRDDPYRDYYVWRDPAPDGGPPNNWVSHFGGPAWTFDEGTGQYYCHLFLPDQPDLNWGNPAVAAEFDRILEHWLGRGVDGFRIDVAHALVKHPDLPDLPLAARPEAVEAGDPLAVFEQFDHVYDTDQPGVLDVYRGWREIAETHDALLLGEVYLLEGERLAPYIANQDGLHASFWFAPVHLSGDDPDSVRAALSEGAKVAPGAVAWVTSSHDVSRAATRLGGSERGRRKALAIAALQFALPGTTFLYQGEELGLEDVPVPPERAQCPIGVRAGAYERSRDPARTPMPWEPGGNLGFAPAGAEPWLPVGDRSPAETVAVQRDDPEALLHRYRALIAARRRLGAAGDPGADVEWLTDAGPVVALRSGPIVAAANLGDEPVDWEPPPGADELVWCADACSGTFGGTLAPGRAVWLAAAHR